MKIICSLPIAMFVFTAPASANYKEQKMAKSQCVKPASKPVQVEVKISQKVRVSQKQAQKQSQKQQQAQQQSQANQQTSIYNEAVNLPGLSSAASIDTRAPELQLNGEQKLFAAAEAEIAQCDRQFVYR